MLIALQTLDGEVTCVCVCVRERERKRERVGGWVCESERERESVCVRERERVCVCARERERESVYVCAAHNLIELIALQALDGKGVAEEDHRFPRRALRGSISKVNFHWVYHLLTIFPHKNEETAPRTKTGYLHEGPSVDKGNSLTRKRNPLGP